MRRLVSFLVAGAFVALHVVPASAVDPGSQLIDCSQADNQVTVSVTSHLDPSCTWTRGFEIVASDVTLDCQGAQIITTDRRTGILITAPTTVALANITVRNCYIEGFLNNIRVTREGFRDLAAGVEYDNAYSNILIEDSTLMNSRGVGLFVDGYVTDVTLRNLHVEGAGSAGIYLEAGSKDNVVENNEIVNNGYSENGPGGEFFSFGGLDFFFWGIGREGLSIDGSRFNEVRNNVFSGNSAGAIFLYKNCGEFVNQRPDRWWHRRYGADGNLIENNTIVGEDNGVWIASRMGENTLPMDCSDPSYQFGVVLDYADNNIVRANTFQDVTYGIRVEDDHNVIEDNVFTGSYAGQEAVIIGTRFRTPALMQPVDGTTVSGNQSTIAGNTHPYRWVYGQTGTTFADNVSLGKTVGQCEGQPAPHGPFVFVVAVVPATPPNTPVATPAVFPTPAPLPPCPLRCTIATAVTEPRIVIRKLDTPPGDDKLTFSGLMTIPHPFVPALDPSVNGVGLLIADATGAPVLDLTLPGGAWNPTTKIGWKVSSSGKWRYLNRSATPSGGITRIVIKDRSSVTPGLLQLSVKGTDGSYVVNTANLPLNGYLVLDPPTAETGQCGALVFTGPGSSCSNDARVVKCR